MEFYRIKHKPTGLYYKPGQGNNLTKKGKVYTGGPNVLNYYTGNIPVRAGGSLLKQLKQIYNVVEECRYGHVGISLPRTDFVIEPFNQTI